MATDPLPEVLVIPDGIAVRNDLVKCVVAKPDGTWLFIHGGNRPATGVVALTWNADGTFSFNTAPGFVAPILISPGGVKYRISVDDAGALLTTVVP